MPAKSYKKMIEAICEEKGGKQIDKIQVDYFNKGIIPDCIAAKAVAFNKSPVQLINDVVRYRNSFGFQKGRK